MTGTLAELDVVRVLRGGGNLPELRALELGDETLLRVLRNLQARGIVDDRGNLT